jgi:hypothetical protein
MAKNGKHKHQKRMLRGGASPTSARRLRAAERQRQALDLRMGGASYDQIAESLGYANRGGAHKAVTAGLATPPELAEGVRELELKRLDRLWLTVWEPAIRGDREAIAICIQLMKRRADFQGLDKAKRREVEHAGQVKVDQSNDQLAAKLLADPVACDLACQLLERVDTGPAKPSGPSAEANVGPVIGQELYDQQRDT